MIIRRRCDKPMRKSKERAFLPGDNRIHWRCTENCKECICCIETDENGNEKHVNRWRLYA